MRSLFAISILFIFLIPTIDQLGVVLEYVSDKESITEKYCENKDKPELQCNGKCHLKKEIAKKVKSNNEKNTKDSNNKTNHFKFQLKYNNVHIGLALMDIFHVPSIYNFDYFNSKIHSTYPSIDTPPPQLLVCNSK